MNRFGFLWFGAVWFGILFIPLALTIGAQSINKDKELSVEQKLRADNFRLRAQLSQCQLTSEQSKLVDEFRKSLNKKEGDEFDWNLLTFKDTEKEGK